MKCQVPISTLFSILVFFPVLLLAGHKVVSPTASDANDNVEINATITLDRPDVTAKLGADPGPGIVLVEVRINPKTDGPLRIGPDDFILLSHDDGQRSKPFEPGQIAGKGGLVVHPDLVNGGVVAGRQRVPLGTGPTGRVSSIPANSGGIGNAGSTQVGISAAANDKDAGNKNLLEALKAKQLPDKETTDEVTGYLYFPLDGKHKLKNMAVLYRGPGGHLDIEFQHETAK